MVTEIRAPMGAIVGTLHCNEGEEVAKGDRIIETEVMKLLTTIVAPCSGKIHYKVLNGQYVEEGELLAVITDE